jgi:8-oxo-dGTP diphosphatase
MAARPEVCVGAVVVDQGRVLLVQRGRAPSAGLWSVPGGRVEPGETLAEAVCRELAEETGLAGTCGDLVGWVERISAEHHFVILDFAVDVADPASASPGDDAVDLAWVPLDELAHRPDLVPGLLEFLVDHGVVVRSGPDLTTA